MRILELLWGFCALNLSFFNRDVAIHRRVFDSLDAAAWFRPGDFHPCDLRGSSNSQNFAGIVRGKVAAAGVLQPCANYPAGGPANLCADGITITIDTFEFQSQPVIFCGGTIL